MSEQNDKIFFFKRLSLIVAALVVVVVVLVFAGIEINKRLFVSENLAQGEATVQRIKPVFDVYTDQKDLSATETPAEEASGGRDQQMPAQEAEDNQEQKGEAEEASDGQEQQMPAQEAEDSQEQQGEAKEASDIQQQQAATEETDDSQQQVAFDGRIDGEMIYKNACQVCHMAGAAGAPQLVAEQWEDRLDKGEDTLVGHAINGFNAMPARGGRSDLSDEQVRASVNYMLAQIEE